MDLRPRPTPKRLPILPLGGAVVFPGALRTVELPLEWAREPLFLASDNQDLCLAMPLVAATETPEPASWFKTATLARVVSEVRVPEGGTRIVLQ